MWPPVTPGGGSGQHGRLSEGSSNPDLVDIPAFTVIFTSRGISKEFLIWTLLILPTSLAFAASVWLFLGTRGQTFPLFLGLGLVGLYMYTGGVTMGLRVTPGWTGWTEANEVLCLAGAVTTLLLFPNGKWVPSWTRWACIGAIGVLIAVPDVGLNLKRLVNPDSVVADDRPGALERAWPRWRRR